MFEELARSIVTRELERAQPLPPERTLAERFGVSRLIVRQAIHRLAEMGLVEVRQGGATLVGDLEALNDPRVLALFYRFTPVSGRRPADLADMIEKQYVQGLSIVEVASRRAAAPALSELVSFVDAQRADTAAEVEAFEREFWLRAATIGENRIFIMEVGWWYAALPDRPVPPEVASASPEVRIAFYRELARRLRDREQPVEYYIAAVRPILDRVISRASRP